ARGEPGGSVPLLPGPLDGRARAGPLVPGDQRAGEPGRSLALPRRGASDGRRTAAAHGAGSDRARAAGRGVLRAGGAGGPGVPRALVAARRRAARLAAMRWTPTRLEALGACGFKFYAREVLGLMPEDDPEAQVGALERGTLAHAVLEALFRAQPRLPADLARARALGQELVAQTRERAARTIVAKDPWLFDVAWGRVAAAVDAL